MSLVYHGSILLYSALGNVDRVTAVPSDGDRSRSKGRHGIRRATAVVNVDGNGGAGRRQCMNGVIRLLEVKNDHGAGGHAQRASPRTLAGPPR
jgi:hypothetical protein